MNLIDLDIARTFSEDPNWRLRGYDKITRRVLAAYSVRNKAVGYCQGLSFLVGILVTVVNEEAAFVILCAIIEDGLLPPDYYTSLAGPMVDRIVLDKLIDRFLPQLDEAFSLIQDDDSVGGQVSHYTFMSIPWHMCLFAANLTQKKSIRLWDFLLSLGPCVLFRISLGILSELADKIRMHVRLNRVPTDIDIRQNLRQIEDRLDTSDLGIYCFHQFQDCTNELINELRETVRNQSSAAVGAGEQFVLPASSTPALTIHMHRQESSDEKYFGDRPATGRKMKKDNLREIDKRTIDGLGDFMGQFRRQRRDRNSAATHHTH